MPKINALGHALLVYFIRILCNIRHYFISLLCARRHATNDPSPTDYINNNNCTIGPLIKAESDKADVLEYVRAQESGLRRADAPDFHRCHQKRQVWLLLSMLVRQNGLISGADLSELLLSNNEREFEFEDDGSPLAKLRHYLMLGQKKVALEHATKNALWGHAFALTHFMSTPQAAPMSNMLAKFVNSTLAREDPISVLFRTLLQKNHNEQTRNVQKTAAVSNLPQFAMLLANDCDVSPVISECSQSKELLKFVVALRANCSQNLVNLANLDTDALDEDGLRKDKSFYFSDELVFVNEIWEFARNLNEFIEPLVPLKLIFAARLFDYGLVNQASKYCYVLRQYHTYYDYYFPGKTLADSSINWDVVMQIVTDIECRIYQFDVAGKGSEKPTVDPAKATPVEKPGEEVRDSPTTNDNTSDEVSDEEDEEEESDEVDRSRTSADDAPANKALANNPTQSGRVTAAQRPPNQHSVPAASSKPIVPPAAVSSTANVSNRQRVRTISNERPADHADSYAVKHTFQPAAAAQSQPPAPPTAVPLFMPAPTTVASDIDFISSPAAAPAFANSADGLMSEDDGRLSAPPPRDDQDYHLNSTAMPMSGTFQPSKTASFPPAFSPIPASPEPELGRQNTQPQYNRNESNASASMQATNHSSSAVGDQTKANNQSKGIFSSLLEKVMPAGPKQAILPDDKNPTIYYDEKLKRWVNKDDPGAADLLDAVAKGPPKMMPAAPAVVQNPALGTQSPSPPATGLPSLPGSLPAANGNNSFSYVKPGARKKPAYVDVWQQHQQQQQKATS